MPLDNETLTTGLRRLFEGKNGNEEPGHYPQTVAEAALAWAGAYRSYAGAATAALTFPVAGELDDAADTLASTLETVFESTDGAEDLAQSIATALADFWLGRNFVSPDGAGSVTTAVPGVLPAELTEVFLAGSVAPEPTAAEQAAKIATAFDTWTRTVQATITPEGGNPAEVPLT